MAPLNSKSRCRVHPVFNRVCLCLCLCALGDTRAQQNTPFPCTWPSLVPALRQRSPFPELTHRADIGYSRTTRWRRRRRSRDSRGPRELKTRDALVARQFAAVGILAVTFGERTDRSMRESGAEGLEHRCSSRGSDSPLKNSISTEIKRDERTYESTARASFVPLQTATPHPARASRRDRRREFEHPFSPKRDANERIYVRTSARPLKTTRKERKIKSRNVPFARRCIVSQRPREFAIALAPTAPSTISALGDAGLA
ncbi:hypothetical protein HYPSUDRAFT_1044495 [Hypholoma sublateritium FD-334 SS-4]|uniref:Uncharacterized protein n=1 Tax=Hypholoma sublateritium (strain FD-334 SS-4) TaxID=945553 RepID=A0A0D2NDH4_HYPSF|nr:hypothetical protein HYPSUDRAFT_1044495 [Hypholoma sublateritium FD-334 SS-4]